jgi:hypothetical protein
VAKIDRFLNVFQDVDTLETVLERLYSKNEILQKYRKIQFLSMLATFYEVKITFEKSW